MGVTVFSKGKGTKSVHGLNANKRFVNALMNDFLEIFLQVQF